MSQPVELSLEQQFSIRSFQTQVQQMSHEQAQDFLIKLYENFTVRENLYKSLVKKEMIGVVDTATITLQDTKECQVLIDYEDLFWLQQWKWYSSKRGYARRNAVGTADTSSTLMQRVILEFHGKDLTGLDVDHINGNPLDNRKSNLRVTTHQQNGFNRKISKNNTSGYKGVSFDKRRNKYVANIKVNYKIIYLGGYETAKEAAIAYNEAAKIHFGEYAKLNDIPEE